MPYSETICCSGNALSQLLQNANLDLITAVATIKSLKTFVESKRESFTEYETKLSGTKEYAQVVTRRRTRTCAALSILDYGQTPDAILSDSEKFRVDNYLPNNRSICCRTDKKTIHMNCCANDLGSWED